MNSSVRFCDNCGATNRADARFCYACGQPQVAYTATTSTTTGLLTSTYELKQRYQILQKLGQGGFGAIYKVEDALFGHTVRAVKEMGMRGLNATETQEAIAAFHQEATLLANLSHPNLPRIYDHFEEHGRWYLVMDYIEGETLATHLEKLPDDHLPIKEAVEIALQLCTVLGYLHNHQPPIIFRDLKPDNIMLTDDGQLYLVDFGIARFFKPGQAKDTMSLGTPGYAAPEQYGRMQTTIRSDIYSLGATLYHLVSGINPGLTPFLFQPLHLDVQEPANVALEKLIMQMLAMQEDQRPADTNEVKQELQNIQQKLQAASIRNIVYPIYQWQPSQPVTLNQSATSPDSIQPRPSVIVSQMGDGDYTSLNEAIQQVEANTFILLKEGLYQENIIIDKAIEIIGNGPKERIILESSDTHCIVIQAAQATLRGLTIRCQAGAIAKSYQALHIVAGQALIEDCAISSNSSSCIAIQNAASNPTIRYCTIHAGATHGITITNSARATLEYCEIFNQQATGIAIATGGNPMIRHCNIHDCQQYGLSIRDQARGTCEDCEIQNNATGIMVMTQSNPLLLRCHIHDNHKYGVELLQDGQGSYQDCTIVTNQEANVSISTGSTPYFYLCKIHEGAYGVAVKDNGRGTLEYCDIFAHQQANVIITTGGDPILQRNNISQSTQYGLQVTDNGRSTIERCTFSENVSGAFKVAPGCNVIWKQNFFK
jgi:F-box protein 11